MFELKSRASRKSQRGLTLIEILVVVVILGILSTIVAVSVLPARDTADLQAANTQIGNFKTALQLYKTTVGYYPTQEQGLEALVKQPQGMRRPEKYQPGGYLDARTVPVDPWGNPYLYVVPGEAGEPYEIFSYGPDGRPGGGDDIGSWN